MRKISLLIFACALSCVACAQCEPIIKADSTLLYDRSVTISLLYEKTRLQAESLTNITSQYSLSQKELKQADRRIFGLKLGLFTVSGLSVGAFIWIATRR